MAANEKVERLGNLRTVQHLIMDRKRALLFWIWLMMLVAYMDRVNITLAGPSIIHDLHLSKAQFGGVLSAFTLGYALMQIPGGALADRVGARGLLVVALCFWSGFTALTGMARSLGAMIATRVAFGVGEGLENGAQFKIIADNFAAKERASASAQFLSALALGPALAVPVTAWLIGEIHWRGLFWVFAGVGLAVAGLMATFMPRGNNGEDGASGAERQDSEPKIGWREAAGNQASWRLFAAYGFFNIAFWGFISWFPTYLSSERHVELKSLGWIGSIPYACGFLAMLLVGRVTRLDGLDRYRPAITAIAYAVAAGGFFLAYTAHATALCIAGLTLAACGLYTGFGPFWGVALDSLPPSARGAVSGFINFGGQVGGFTAPYSIGKIVDVTHSFTGGFVFMIAALIMAAGVMIWEQFAVFQMPPAARRSLDC